MDVGELVELEGGLVDADKVAVSLTEVAGEYEHVTDALHVAEVLRTFTHGLDVEVVDTAHVIGGECYLLMLAVRKLDEVVGRGDDGSVSGCPREGGLEL